VPHLAEAERLFSEVALADDYADFLTLPAYEAVLAAEDKA
jgi:malate synthase